MKTIASKLYALAVGTIFLLASCTKEDTSVINKEELVGTWEFTSFKVDTSEYMGTLVDSAGIRFNAYTGAFGNFSQTIQYADGERDVISGTYSVNEEDEKVTMTADGETNIADVKIDGNKLEYKGKQHGQSVDAKAQKK